jgi:plasmid stabilization system protein ParE
VKTRRVCWARSALNDLLDTVTYIASDNPAAARRVAAAVRRAGADLGGAAIGRPGRVVGTYEKLVPRLPYILAYAIEAVPGRGEMIVILRVIHGARDWPDSAWPR